MKFPLCVGLNVGFVLLVAPLLTQFADAADQDGDNVSAYSIGSNGALTPIRGSPFLAGSKPDSVAVDSAAKFVYVANEVSKNVSAYGIAPDGALTLVPGSPFTAGIGPNSVAVDPTGKFLYVANKGWPH